jgi:hypothetical protein
MKKSFVIILATIFLASGMIISTDVVRAATITVCSSGCDYTTIQGAIDAASSGDVINVGAGEYEENITVNKKLEINGAGNGTDSGSNTIITSTVASVPVVKINASGSSETDRLKISNLRIQGTGTDANGITIVTGGGSFTTLDRIVSVYNKKHGLEGNFSGAIEDLEIKDCVLSNNEKAGFRTGSSAGINGLTVTDTHADNNKVAGLYFNGPITGLTLTGGSFDNNKGSSDPTNGLGIYATRFNDFIDQKPMVLNGFTADNNIRGVIINKFYGPFSMINASVSNNAEEGIAIGPGANVEGIEFINVNANNNGRWNLWLISYLGYAVNDITIENCTFNGSTGAGEGYGLYLYITSSNSELTNLSVVNSEIANNNIGVYLRAGTTMFDLSDNSMHYNNITGNGTGVYNSIAGFEFNATHNWWGTAVEGEISALMNGIIDYAPWLCEKAPTSWVSVNGMCISRTAEITAPEEGESVSGEVDFEAYLISSNTNEKVQWAVRKGTCSSSANTVFGNVDGHNDSYSWVYNSGTFKYEFSATADTSSWNIGEYCFVFNPGGGIRLTRRFVIEEPPIGPPTDKSQCMKDGWKIFNNPVFRNQGDCVSYIQSNPNAKGNRKDN